MKDSFKREISYLRLSITDLCNLKCKYCTTHKQIKVKHEDILSIEELANAVKVSKNLGINKVRITGGEPLLRHGILDLIEQISKYVKDIGLTTNAVLLSQLAPKLKKAGLKTLNISLDTLDKDKYRKLTGGDINLVLKGIKKAYDYGFKIKINAVLEKGINDKSLDEMLDFSKKYKATLRFIELMPLKDTEKYFKTHFVSSEEIIKQYKMKFDHIDGTAEYYKYKNHLVGFIRPISNKFCKNCNRIRITSFGEVIPCLHSNKTYSIKKYINNEEMLQNKIKEIINLKPEKHHLEDGGQLKKDMRNIGG